MRIVLVIAGVIAFLAACFLFIRSEGGKLAVSFGHDSKIKNILRYPFGMRAFFAFANVLLAVFALVLDFLPLANIQESTAVKIVLLTFAFVIILIYCVISLWKIEYGGEGFTYRNYFGRKRAYKFNQVEILKIGNAFYFTKNGKKVVRIERIVTNADYLQSAYFNANFNAKKVKI